MPAFCPTRHGRCEQLAHSCYAVTDFSGIRSFEPVSFKHESNALFTRPTTPQKVANRHTVTCPCVWSVSCERGWNLPCVTNSVEWLTKTLAIACCNGNTRANCTCSSKYILVRTKLQYVTLTVIKSWVDNAAGTAAGQPTWYVITITPVGQLASRRRVAS